MPARVPDMDAALRPRQSAYWALTGLVLAGVVWFFGGTFSAMVDIWLTSSNFNHCLFIPPASAILVWRRRHRLAQIPPRASAAGVFLFSCCAALWALGALGNVSTVQNLAAVAMITATIWAALGRAITREIAFPLVYLFFMVPFGEFLMPAMMDLTADLTVFTARLSGLAVYKDGLFFTIPNGSFKIVEACSGIRMLIASVAIGVLFAHLAFVSWARRLLFVVAMIVVSIAANVVRAYIVVMIAYYTGMETIADHVILGYVVFACVILAMLVVGSRFADFDHLAFERIPEAPPGGARPLWASLVAGVAVVAIAGTAPVGVSAVEDRAARYPATSPMLVPPAHAEWSGPIEVRGRWSPQFTGHDIVSSGTYERSSGQVDAFMLFYSRQAQGAEVINARNRIFDPGRWIQLYEGVAESELAGGGSLRYFETVLRDKRGGGRLVRHWYIVDGKPQHRPLEIKLRELKNSVMGRPTPATVVAISTRFADDRDAAARTLDDFVDEIYVPAYPLPAATE